MQKKCELVRGEDRSVRNATCERRFEPLRGGGSDGFGSERGKRVTYNFDGLADEVG